MIFLPIPNNSKYAPDIPTICITIMYFILDLVGIGGIIALGYFAVNFFLKKDLFFGGLCIFCGLIVAVLSILSIAITVDTIKDIKEERNYPPQTPFLNSDNSEENHKSYDKTEKECSVSDYVNSLNFKK